MPLRPIILSAVLFVAAGPTLPAWAEPGEIKGQDVLGDKTKSAQDGFSQSPVPREESAGKDAPNPGGPSTDKDAKRPAADKAASDPSGAEAPK